MFEAGGGALGKVVRVHGTEGVVIGQFVDAGPGAPVLEHGGLLGRVDQPQELRRIVVVAAAAAATSSPAVAAGRAAAAASGFRLLAGHRNERSGRDHRARACS